jgi:pyridoxine 5-phosphate synthase
MIGIALRLRPHQVTLVPERREEITTEGGLDVLREKDRIHAGVARLNAACIRTSLFVAPDRPTIDASRAAGAAAIELHTGAYAHASTHLGDLRDAASYGASIGLAVHAGHGLTTANVGPVAAIPEIEELNIGHWVIARAIVVGLENAVRELRSAMDAARATF